MLEGFKPVWQGKHRVGRGWVRASGRQSSGYSLLKACLARGVCQQRIPSPLPPSPATSLS